MPKISEEDWDLLENKICIATFLQGLPVGNKTYNNYAVVPTTITREYVDEDDIYIIKNDNTYAKVNDKTLSAASIKTKSSLGYYPGVWGINFRTKILNEIPYIPMSYRSGSNNVPYLESYSTIMGTDLTSITYSDMYRYMRQKEEDHYKIDEDVRRAYYVALGRERKGTFKFTNYGD